MNAHGLSCVSRGADILVSSGASGHWCKPLGCSGGWHWRTELPGEIHSTCKISFWQAYVPHTVCGCGLQALLEAGSLVARMKLLLSALILQRNRLQLLVALRSVDEDAPG